MSGQLISVGPVAQGFNAAVQAVLGSYAKDDVVVVYYGEYMGSASISVPSGWTDKSDLTNAPQARAFAIVAPSNTLTMPSIKYGTDRDFCYAIVLRGVTLTDAFAPIGRASNHASDIIGVASPRTPSADGATVLFFGVRNKTTPSNGTSYSPPANFSLLQQLAVDGAAPSSALSIWIQGTATPIPANTTMAGSKADGSAQTMQALLIALLPAAAVGPKYTADPATSSIGATSVSFNATLDSASTEYGVAVPHGTTAPSITQVKAGQNGSGAAATAAANVAATAAVPVALSLSGFTSATAYDFYFVGHNTNGDTVLKSVLNVTTAATSSLVAALAGVTADGYVLAYTPTGTGMVYVVALTKGSPSLVGNPTAVRTGTPTGFISRFNKAGITGVPDTITLSGLTLPKADLYIEYTVSSVDSTVTAFLDQLKAPAAGRQYTAVGTLSSSSPLTDAQISPPIVTGDILDTVLRTPSGYLITVTSGGDFITDAHGDESREIIGWNFYDDSAGEMRYTSDSSVVVNNQPPQPTTNPADAFLITFAKGIPVSPADVGYLFNDSDGDVTTVVDTQAVLTQYGLSIVENQIVGTPPNVDAIVQLQLDGEDQYGASSSVIGTLIIGKVTCPDLSTVVDEAGAIALLASAYLNEQTNRIASTADAGTILAQSFLPGAQLDPRTVVLVSISTGVTTPITTPREGLELIGRRVFIDGGDYTLIAYTNPQQSIGLDTVLADLVQPVAVNGYAPILLNGTWVTPNGIVTYTHPAGASNDGSGNPCWYATGLWSADVTGIALIDATLGKIQFAVNLRDDNGNLTTFRALSGAKQAVDITNMVTN